MCIWDDSGRHDIHTMLHDNQFVISNNTTTNFISSEASEAGMLDLLIGGNYEVSSSESLRWHDIGTIFHEELYRRS
jgi:hypothetical protein